MRSFIVGLALLASTPTVTLAATLPLQEGDYSRGACTAGHSDISDSIYVAPKPDPKFKSDAFISPGSEGNMGNCMLKSVKASGNRYSGKAPCTAGNAEVPSGTYTFDWQVIDRQTFVSRGQTYRWCAEHR
jgi:hypothetical protein